MASIRKLGGKWQAQVARRGIRKSKTFDTKTEAKDWASREEYLIKSGQGQYGTGTLGDLFDRYARTVSPGKRGARWEMMRLEAFQRDRLSKIPAAQARPGDFADWRDRRLDEVKPSTVRREMVLMSAVMTVARKEWGIFPASPIEGVKKPPPSKDRDRRVSDEEIEVLEAACVTDMQRKVLQAFRFAVETGMRAGEIAGLTEIRGRVAHLPETKNGQSRNVPLSKRALVLWVDGGFGLTSRQIDTTFRTVRFKAKIEGLTFHDSRREFISRASKKLDVLSLAKVVGHNDPKQLLTYFEQPPEDLAELLD